MIKLIKKSLLILQINNCSKNYFHIFVKTEIKTIVNV